MSEARPESLSLIYVSPGERFMKVPTSGCEWKPVRRISPICKDFPVLSHLHAGNLLITRRTARRGELTHSLRYTTWVKGWAFGTTRPGICLKHERHKSRYERGDLISSTRSLQSSPGPPVQQIPDCKYTINYRGTDQFYVDAGHKPWHTFHIAEQNVDYNNRNVTDVNFA